VVVHNGFVQVSGLPDLAGDRLGDPESVRWVAIRPAGAVVVHTSSNRRGDECDERIQWKLVQDIYRVIDPDGRCADHLTAVGEIVDDDERGGMFMVPCRHDDPALWPENPVMSHILRGRRGDYPENVYGTAVWLGYADDDGLHASIADGALASLRMEVANAHAQLERNVTLLSF